MLITEATPGSTNHNVDNNKTAPQIRCGPEVVRFVSIKTTGHALIINLFLALSFKVAAVVPIFFFIVVLLAESFNEQKSAFIRCGIRRRKG